MSRVYVLRMHIPGSTSTLRRNAAEGDEGEDEERKQKCPFCSLEEGTEGGIPDRHTEYLVYPLVGAVLCMRFGFRKVGCPLLLGRWLYICLSDAMASRGVCVSISSEAEILLTGRRPTPWDRAFHGHGRVIDHEGPAQAPTSAASCSCP